MANCKALIAAILLCLCSARIRCDVVPVSPLASPEQEQEIQKLRSKDEISGRKEETLLPESIVREKTAQIAALVGELEVLQVTNVFDDESMMKANTHNEMLEI